MRAGLSIGMACLVGLHYPTQFDFRYSEKQQVAIKCP